MADFLIGAASVDITPPAGLAMAGFAARSEPAVGMHDSLSVRALVVDDTALVVVDVIGLDKATVETIKLRVPLPSDRVVVTSLHTHGGPQTLVGRQLPGIDKVYMQRLESAAVDAVTTALANRQPADMWFGIGADPGIARNRRRKDGPTDSQLPVVEFVARDGSPIAVLIAYACHPVVLGADNRHWTADYPGVVRRQIEAARPGTLAIFATGCTGDANTGHSAYASWTLDPSDARTFAAAEGVGETIARAGLSAPLERVVDPASIAISRRTVELGFVRREQVSMPKLIAGWRGEMNSCDAGRRALLQGWIEWAERGLPADLESLTRCEPVSALRWGSVEIVCLPGEIFAETAQAIRDAIGNPLAIVLGFADDNPGYIPPRREYGFGGYEVDDAHRYYGLPATFAPGSAEQLAAAAVDAIQNVRMHRGEHTC